MTLNHLRKWALCFVGLIAFSGCVQTDVVYQTSSIDALLQGEYGPLISISQLKKHGDTGIGTFEHLDGEMIMLRGIVYQIQADGSVQRRNDQTQLPFSTVKFFAAQQTRHFKHPLTYEQFTQQLDRELPTPNWFYALIAHGTFKSVKTRSVPKQSPPYRPLIQVVKSQPTWVFENVTGTLVGFRCPTFAKGLNVPGYHLHFLRDDLAGGGHVLDFEVDDITLQIDPSRQWLIDLPNTPKFQSMNLAQDRSKELHKVEKDH